MNPLPPTKFCAFIDESGQDTRGRLFVVATVVVPAGAQERLRQQLERIEEVSRKDKKWTKAKPRQRYAYMEQVLQLAALQERLFYARFEQTTVYLPCMLHTIAGAVTAVAAGQPSRTTVFIDGLQQAVRHEVAMGLRQRQIRIGNVRGMNDRNDALMRLADALAGFVRHAIEGRPDLARLFEVAKARRAIQEIRA